MTKTGLARILFASACGLLAVHCTAEDSTIESAAVAPDGDCNDPEDHCDDGGGGGGDDGVDDGGGGSCDDGHDDDGDGHDCDGGGGDGGGGGGGDGGGGGGGDCGCNECGCDVDLDASVNADVSLQLAGTGLFVGLSECGLEVSGNFHASLDGSATLSTGDGTCTITGMAEGSLEVSTGNGCACTGVEAVVNASGSANVMIEANLASCDLFCDAHAEAKADSCGSDSCGGSTYAAAHFKCMAACEGALHISAHASLDASASLMIDQAHADAWVGHELDLSYDKLLDENGNEISCD